MQYTKQKARIPRDIHESLIYFLSRTRGLYTFNSTQCDPTSIAPWPHENAYTSGNTANTSSYKDNAGGHRVYNPPLIAEFLIWREFLSPSCALRRLFLVHLATRWLPRFHFLENPESHMETSLTNNTVRSNDKRSYTIAYTKTRAIKSKMPI